MRTFLCDDTAENVDPDFDAALIVYAECHKEAAMLWRQYYSFECTRGARVTEVPDHAGVATAVAWDSLKTVTV